MQTFRFCWAVELLASCAYLCTFMFVTSAQASMISTQTLLQRQQRSACVDHVQELLAEERVTEQMVKLGVDPAEVQARVAAMTDQQLAQLENRLDELPAGGTSGLAVVGIVFIVLIILDIVGVLSLFSR